MNSISRVALGALGGAVGALAMTVYNKQVAPLVTNGKNAHLPDQHSVAPLGQLHAPGESSAAAVGRLAYEATKGRNAPREARESLGEQVHWGMGIASGAVYGLLTRDLNLLTSLGFSMTLWVLVDEGLLPLAGLHDGPAGDSVAGHASRLASHLAYGAGLGLTVLALQNGKSADR